MPIDKSLSDAFCNLILNPVMRTSLVVVLVTAVKGLVHPNAARTSAEAAKAATMRPEFTRPIKFLNLDINVPL
jgi:hypothetical protein